MVIVPNVSWGMGFGYELDLLAISLTGCGHEIEIKTSRQDLRRDSEKRHFHDGAKIKYLWYAGPVDMADDFEEIVVDRAGIILVEDGPGEMRDMLVIARKATANPEAKGFTNDDIGALARLGTMRYWSREK